LWNRKWVAGFMCKGRLWVRPTRCPRSSRSQDGTGRHRRWCATTTATHRGSLTQHVGHRGASANPSVSHLGPGTCLVTPMATDALSLNRGPSLDRRLHRQRTTRDGLAQAGGGGVAPCTTSTGHTACSAQAALTDPRRRPANPPWPLLPTTSMRASSDAFSSSPAAPPSRTVSRIPSGLRSPKTA
jgi:hypothetical protein